MKAHELQPNNFYRAEKRSTLDGGLLTDVAFASWGVRVRHARCVDTNPLEWDYFGPLSLRTEIEIRDEILLGEADILSEMET